MTDRQADDEIVLELVALDDAEIALVPRRLDAILAT
jgi:hypothetical protein